MLRALTCATLSALTAIALLAGSAVAQDEIDPLAEEAALLGESGLLEKKSPEKPVLAEPDQKLLDEVEARRAELQEKLNDIQTRVSQFPDLDEDFGNLMVGMSDGLSGYIEKHIAALQAYRDAVAEGNKKAEKKTSRAVIKLRKGFLKKMKKLDKKLAKLIKDTEKLEAKVAAEKAEEEAAAEAGADE